jgi:hypothetical protein
MDVSEEDTEPKNEGEESSDDASESNSGEQKEDAGVGSGAESSSGFEDIPQI